MEYVFLLFFFGLLIVVIVGMCKVFSKAGKSPILAIIPIVNIFVLIEIAGRPSWWVLLYMLPMINLIVSVIISMDVAKKFGKGEGFGFGLFFLPFIFFPILGFGDAQYNAGGGKNVYGANRNF